MVRELLIQFYRNTRFKPTRIVLYRDGVSEGQFLNVRNIIFLFAFLYYIFTYNSGPSKRTSFNARSLYDVGARISTGNYFHCSSETSSYKVIVKATLIRSCEYSFYRLFAVEKKDQVGKANNIPPGTTVDVGITHPTEFDFYLCSHAGIQVCKFRRINCLKCLSTCIGYISTFALSCFMG